MIRILILAAGLLGAAVISSAAAAENGLLTKESAYGFDETLSRLEAALDERGITVFNRIDHAAGAAEAGAELRPTMLVIFGNPQVGSQLMAASQTMGLDLPLKVLVHEGEDGVTRVSYNDMAFLGERHGLPADHPVLGRVAGGVNMVTDAATGVSE